MGRLLNPLSVGARRRSGQTTSEPYASMALTDTPVLRAPVGRQAPAPAGTVQRRSSSTGIAKCSLSKGFGRAAFDFWQDEGNKEKLPRGLSDAHCWLLDSCARKRYSMCSM